MDVPIIEGGDLSSQEVKEHSTCAEQQAEARKNIGLEDCLNLFLAEETLGKDDAW